MLFGKINKASEFVTSIPKRIVEAGSDVIDFGADLQNRINAIGQQVASDSAENTAEIKGAEIGKNVGSFIVDNAFLIVALTGLTFLITRK